LVYGVGEKLNSSGLSGISLGISEMLSNSLSLLLGDSIFLP
jgi:hypothetical protein